MCGISSKYFQTVVYFFSPECVRVQANMPFLCHFDCSKWGFTFPLDPGGINNENLSIPWSKMEVNLFTNALSLFDRGFLSPFPEVGFICLFFSPVLPLLSSSRVKKKKQARRCHFFRRTFLFKNKTHIFVSLFSLLFPHWQV